MRGGEAGWRPPAITLLLAGLGRPRSKPVAGQSDEAWPVSGIDAVHYPAPDGDDAWAHRAVTAPIGEAAPVQGGSPCPEAPDFLAGFRHQREHVAGARLGDDQQAVHHQRPCFPGAAIGAGAPHQAGRRPATFAAVIWFRGE